MSAVSEYGTLSIFSGVFALMFDLDSETAVCVWISGREHWVARQCEMVVIRSRLKPLSRLPKTGPWLQVSYPSPNIRTAEIASYSNRWRYSLSYLGNNLFVDVQQKPYGETVKNA